MRFIRRVLTILIFWSLVGVSLAAAVQVWWLGLPSNDIHWAVRRIGDPRFGDSLDEEKLDLARRLEREFSRGVEIRPAVEKLSPADRERFEANFGQLTELWLFDKVDTFYSFNDDRDRGRFLDRQVTRVKTWPIFTAAIAESSSQEDKARLERLANYLLNRAQELPPKERQRLQRFLFELALRSYQVQQFFPGIQLTF